MMNSDAKVEAAKALDPILSVLLKAYGEHLVAVRYRVSDGCLGRIALEFASTFLIFEVNSDDDTLDIHFGRGTEPDDGSVDVSSERPWVGKVGKTFGWSWVMLNQQGYMDGVLLGLGGAVPEVVITVVASEFKVRLVS